MQRENTRFNEIRLLAHVFGQIREDLIRLIELQRLQIDLKIQLIKIDPNREITQFVVEFSQTKNPRTLNTNHQSRTQLDKINQN